MPSRMFKRSSAIFFCLLGLLGNLLSEEYLSNLGNRFVDPANPTMPSENEIGDIHALFSPYQPFAVQFFTGSGSDERRYAKMYAGAPPAVPTNSTTTEKFELNYATFEFDGGHAQAWSNLNVQLYHQVGKENVLVGELGNPVVNPALTQWPESLNPGFCTTYVDYHPLKEILLEPSAAYWLSLSVADGIWPTLGPLFSLSSKFVSSGNWRMGPTVTRDPSAAGEYLKVAIGATAVVGTNATTLPVSSVRLSATRIGRNVVLSWPASTASFQLYASPSFESDAWSPVSAQPVVVNDQFVVTLPLSGYSCCFRLQSQ